MPGRPKLLSLLVLLQLAYVAAGLIEVVKHTANPSSWDLVYFIGVTSVIALPAAGMWMGIRWAYIVEIGILGALVVGLSIVAVVFGTLIVEVILVAGICLSYLCLSSSVRRFYGKGVSGVATT